MIRFIRILITLFLLMTVITYAISYFIGGQYLW